MKTFKELLKKIWCFVLDLAYNIIVVVLVVSLLRSFIISPFHVSGTSMDPTLNNNDYIILDKLSYSFGEPHFGDVVVFTPPNPRMRQVNGPHCFIAKIQSLNLKSDSCILPDFFIKRIIGEPGDIIAIENGDVYRNGEILDEIYLSNENNHNTKVKATTDYEEYTVPDGRYFVLGDNRNASSDSRSVSREWTDKKTGELDPYVYKNDIEGKFLFTMFSPLKVKAFFAD